MKFIAILKQAKAAAIQLKNLKSMPTHDGEAWSCTVYLNGIKLGPVFEGGHGGCIEVDFSEAQQQALVDRLKAVGYELDLVHPQFTLDAPTTAYGYLELSLPDISAAFEELKVVKRKLKKNTLYRLKSQKPDDYMISKTPFSPDVAAKLRKHYGDDLDIIFNEELAVF